MSFVKIFSLICVALFCLSSCNFVQQKTSIRPPHSGLFPVKQNGKVGYIDSSGKIVINPQFDDGKEFYEDLAQVVISGKVGFIDKSGKLAISPQFSDASMFSEGLAFVQVDDKIGVIDKTGKFVVNPQFDSYKPIDFAKFSDGVAPVRVEKKIGYIDTTGKIIINPQFLSGNSFSEGLAHVTIGGRDDEGYLNEDAKMRLHR